MNSDVVGCEMVIRRAISQKPRDAVQGIGTAVPASVQQCGTDAAGFMVG
jgi:hypothetical protein